MADWDKHQLEPVVTRAVSGADANRAYRRTYLNAYARIEPNNIGFRRRSDEYEPILSTNSITNQHKIDDGAILVQLEEEATAWISRAGGFEDA